MDSRCCGGVVQGLRVAEDQTTAEHTAFALDEGQAVVAVVGAQVVHALVAALVLHADDVAGETDALVDVLGAAAYVGDVDELDHGFLLL